MPVKRATADALDVIRRMRYATDSVAVGFSCGKDSVVTADLCLKWFDRVVLFYMHVVPDLSFHRDYLAWWERRAGKKLVTGKIIRMPHWALSQELALSSYRPDSTAIFTGEIPVLRLRDAEMHVAKLTGVTWFAYGQKKVDSLERRAMLNKCSGVMLESNRGFPLAEWSHRTVTQYMRDNQIPLSPEYEHFGSSYGGQLEGKDLAILAEHYPGDYARLLERFPFAEAERFRYEVLEKERAAGANGKRPARKRKQA